MSIDDNPRLFVLGGLSGIVGTLCYVTATTVSLGSLTSYVVAMVWPVLSIIFVYSLFRFIQLQNPSASNQLAFVFACLAFTLVACMISVQAGVGIGIDEYFSKSSKNEQELLDLVRRCLRLVDMALDVAWDVFIGTALLFLSLALKQHIQFGRWWGITSALLGATLIVLNLITFPWPPNSRHLIDIGPAIGLFIIILSTRLLLLGRRMGRSTALGNVHKQL